MIADSWGYRGMFTAFAAFALLSPVLAAVTKEVQVDSSQSVKAPKGEGAAVPLSVVLIAISFCLLAGGTFVGQMTRSLAMAERGLPATAISATNSVTGLVLLPLPILLGWLSGRFGRTVILVGTFVSRFASLVLLSIAGQLWQFYAYAAVGGLGSSAQELGSALIADQVPRAKLGRGLAFFRSSIWLGGVAGFALAGVMNSA